MRQLSVSAFAAALRERFEQATSARPVAQGVVPADAPKVFLCYRSTNREEVTEWEQKLLCYPSAPG